MTSITSGTDSGKLVSELLPERVLPKVLNTFGLTSAYVFIICWIAGASLMATAGWGSIPMWIAGYVLFLIPAGLAVAELANLWPAQGGVYIWAYRTMNETAAFFGGFLSWIPVVLVGVSGPAVVLSYFELAFHITNLPLAWSVIAQVLFLWLASSLALRKLVIGQRLMNTVFIIYSVIVAAVLITGIVHAGLHGSATPVNTHDLLTFNFGKLGWVFGAILLYLVGVETPFNMGAEFLSVKRSATRMILWGSIALSLIYVAGTIGTMLSLPIAKIDVVNGFAASLKVGVPGFSEIAAILIAVVVVTALMTYESAYSRLVFVSGLERHLPRLFTHLNPRTRNPVTAILIQTCLSTVLVVVLNSGSNLANVVQYITGGLSVVWLFSGFFFFVPVVIARYKYKERYKTESFWRIPGGIAGAWIVAIVGSAGTGLGIYYSFTLPFGAGISQGSWMTWVGAIVAGSVVAAILVYYFGRRSAAKLSQADTLAHLAVLETPEPSTEAG
jgi:amino acid transporter